MTAPELEDLARGYQHEGKLLEANLANPNPNPNPDPDPNPNPNPDLNPNPNPNSNSTQVRSSRRSTRTIARFSSTG